MEKRYTAKLPLEKYTDSVKERQDWSCVDMENISHTWTLNNFQTNPNEFRSSVFTTSDLSKWCLVAKIVHNSYYGENYLSLYLCLISSKKPTVQAKFILSVLNPEGDERAKQSDHICEFINYCNKANCTLIWSGHDYNYCQHDFDKWGYDEFVSVNTPEANGSPTNITILCEISLVTDTINISDRSRGVRLEVSECELLNKFGLLLENKSPVFQAMFENEMKEKKTNQVDIDDMEPEVLEEMLPFIYTGKTTNLEKMADSLLAASDKYQLNTLKVLCQEALCKSLTIENAAEILILADLHSADKLKAKAINFINTCTGVTDTAGFKFMKKSYPHLIIEAYEAMRTNPSTGFSR
ncbi:PREDICTED: speckle-type POZ protein A-like [Vollenhovia emeryi]|uniref:speckle-type POZ protein A-like n=1 Tax=Vollenhovia emeryi TaxID=411798 RepID=UPI0005F38929|nr:PREDICTED: speckle-type POZ protein A-like [Vollenhovia emeryi]